MGGSDGVDPHHIMLEDQFLQICTVNLTSRIGIGRHVGWIKFVSQPLGKSTEVPGRRHWQRAYDPTNFEFTFGSAHRFFIFNLGGNNHERYIPKAP
jgi:hypothetical protein